MARDSGARASDLLKLSERFNEVIAFDFDLACTARLRIYDDEREGRLFEALGVGSLTSALGAVPASNEGGGPMVIEAGWDVA